MTREEIISEFRNFGFSGPIVVDGDEIHPEAWLEDRLNRYAYEVAVEAIGGEVRSAGTQSMGWNACRSQFLANIKTKTNQ